MFFDADTLTQMIRRLVTSRAFYLILGIVFVGLLLTRWVEALGGPAGIWERFGWLAPAISVPFHAFIAVTPLPSDLVSIANGAVYGFWAGAGFNWLGWFIASFLQYSIGRRVRHDFDVEAWLARSPSWLRRFPADHPVFIIGSRFVPYAGGHLATLVPSAMGVALGRFTWCTAVALVPSSLVMAGVGAGLLLL